MANLKARDSDSVTKFLKATGEGSETSPFIVEHSDSATLQQLVALTDKTNIVATQTDSVKTVLAALNDLLTTVNTATTSINNKTGDYTINQFTLDAIRSGINNLLTDSIKKANLVDTQPVSLASIPLASGSALESRQIALLTQIDSVLTKLNQLQISLSDILAATGTIKNFPNNQVVSGAVGITNFPATQPISGSVNIGNSVTISNFPASQSINDSQTIYVDSNFLLSGNASVTGSSRDGLNKNSVRGWVFTNVNGTLYIEQSRDNLNWRRTDIVPITGSVMQATTFSFRLHARYYRLNYSNGNQAQNSFELISTVFGIGL